MSSGSPCLLGEVSSRHRVSWPRLGPSRATEEKGMMMRKRLIHQTREDVFPSPLPWLDVEHLAEVELTSEDPACPIEAALRPGAAHGWRASHPGAQVIRLMFDRPQRLHRLHLVFVEEQQARTQEFVVQWSADGGQSYRELVRQQYTFSPPGTTREVEDYAVHLDGVTALAIQIIPDITGGEAWATLGALRLACRNL